VAEAAAETLTQAEQNSLPSATTGGLAALDAAWEPEEFWIPPGKLSPIDRTSDPGEGPAPFRCEGCTRPECQGATGCAAIDWDNWLTSYLRQILLARVYEVAIETPMHEAPQISAQLGNRILLKREDMQKCHSFKVRGAYNKMAQMTEEERAPGVICSSAGNHAQGVALVARTLGCNALICMPESAPKIKVDAVRRLGGTIHLHGESYTEAQTYAHARAKTDGRLFISAYDDPYTIAGQGTVGKEIMEQCPDVNNLTYVFVPVGGGGLIAGIAAYIKAVRPNIKIIGVEPTGANTMSISLSRGRRTTLAKIDVFADGVALKTVGRECFRLCRELIEGVVLVNNAAISAAIRDVYDETRTVLEAAGALSVAGARAYLKKHNIEGATVVCVTSGANMNFDRLRMVSELAGVGARREAMLATTIPEERGAFVHFAQAALELVSGVPITEVKYRISADPIAHILYSIGIVEDEDAATVVDRLNQAGFPTENITAIEEAQVHLRHLVGGRARSFGFTGEVAEPERIFQVEFPEVQSALQRFMAVMDSSWNVSLFHYRQSGNRSSTILLGLQAADEALDAFGKAVAELGPDYSFRPLSDDAQAIFAKFIQ